MAKRSRKLVTGFVLRSGYVVPFDGNDIAATLDHLKAAIANETMRLAESQVPVSDDYIGNAIYDEVMHVTLHMDATVAVVVLSGLLGDAVIAHLGLTKTPNESEPPRVQ